MKREKSVDISLVLFVKSVETFSTNFIMKIGLKFIFNKNLVIKYVIIF